MGDNGAKCTTAIKNYSLFFTTVAIEALVIVPCLTYTLINLISFDKESYDQYHTDFSTIISYNFLAPLLAIQALWIVTNIISTLAIHLTSPYLFIPNIVIVFVGFIASLFILVPSVEYIIHKNGNIQWFVTSFVIALSLFIIGVIVCISIRVVTLRRLIKKKKTVQGTVEKPNPAEIEVPAEPIPPPPIEHDDFDVSFSRRSTMSMNDDRYAPPPKI